MSRPISNRCRTCLNFPENNGTLDACDHAVLISHTANDILTTETGLYSDRDGIAVANSFGVFSPITAADPLEVLFPSSFFYWTDAVQDITPATSDPLFALLTETGQNVPAPWVPFTRAGTKQAQNLIAAAAELVAQAESAASSL